MAVEEMIISAEVPAGQLICQTFVVPAHIVGIGQVRTGVRIFHTTGPSSEHATVKLVWDKGGAGERVLWTSPGIDVFDVFISLLDADGIKIIAICLDNGSSDAIDLSGYAEINHARAQV